MKKVVLFALTMCAMLVFTACGGDKSSNENNGADYATYREAVAANDFEAAHKIIAQAEADHVKLKPKDFEEEYGIDYYNGIKTAKEEIFDKEVKFLAADGSAEANARLVFLFTDFDIKGARLPKGLNDYYAGDNSQYPGSVRQYNSKLNLVLDLAISQDNKDLAQKIIKLYKENMDVFKGGSSHHATDKNGYSRHFDIAPDGTEVDGNHCYVTYSWRDKEEAQKKFEDAFSELSDGI